MTVQLETCSSFSYKLDGFKSKNDWQQKEVIIQHLHAEQQFLQIFSALCVSSRATTISGFALTIRNCFYHCSEFQIIKKNVQNGLFPVSNVKIFCISSSFMIVNSISEWIVAEYLGFQMLVEQIEDFKREFGRFETSKGNTFYKHERDNNGELNYN